MDTCHEWFSEDQAIHLGRESEGVWQQEKEGQQEWGIEGLRDEGRGCECAYEKRERLDIPDCKINIGTYR